MATETTRGLLLRCPLCGEAEATIQLCLADLDTFHCEDCDADFSAATVRAFVDQWLPVLAWVALAPTGGES